MSLGRLCYRRRAKEFVFLALTGGAAALALFLLGGIVAYVVGRGYPALSWEFLTTESRRGGAEGGIFYQLIGTGILALSAASVAMPLALGMALFQGEYVKDRRLKGLLSWLLYLLNGVPSIVFGVIGFFVLVKAAGLEKSWLCGGLVLGFMIVPTITVATLEAIDRVPRLERDAARALGLNPPKVIWSLVIPRSLGGLVTGTLLGLARAAGETAPIMFTAAVFAGERYPAGVVDSPVVALPYHILNLAQDATSPAVERNAWGSALILLFLALLLSGLAWVVRERLSEVRS